MSWKEVAFELPAQLVEQGTECLESMGALAISLYDAHDNPIFEPPPDSDPILWDQSILVGLFEEPIDSAQLVESVHQTFPDLPVKIRTLEEQNWVAICQSHFPAQQYNNLWVCPSWAEKPEDEHAVCLKLDPGMAFGTGTHPTTKLCLEWLSKAPLQGKDVIDYGCGSGILGIAAALLGANRVWAVDYDPQALTSTRQNAENNGIDEKQLTIHAPNDAALKDIQADVLVANILATPLLELKNLFKTLLKPDGSIVLSGILESQKDELIQAYSDGFEIIDCQIQEGWVCLVGKACR